MQKLIRPLAAIAIGASVLSANWLTFGGNPQRNGWAKDETILSTDTIKNLELQWKLKLDNEPKGLNALTTPVVVNPVYSNKGAFEYVVVAGSSDNLFVIDADTGKLAWNKHFTNEAKPPSGFTDPDDYFCPYAINSTPIIDTSKGGPTAYVISTDGKLHALNMIDGEDRFPPTQFVPAYSKTWSLNENEGVVYTTTSQGCARTKSGVWAMNVKGPDRTVNFFQSDLYGGGIWGRGGTAIASTGTIYAETGDGVFAPNLQKYADTFLALSPKDVKLTDYFAPANANYLTRKDLDMGNVTPVVFPYKGRELVVGAGKEGTLFILDAKSLGGDTHRKPLFAARFANEANDIAGQGFWGAFASWEDTAGTRWVYAPAWGPLHSQAPAFAKTNGETPHGSLLAFKVEDKDGQPVLTPAWASHDMALPEPPIVANGVVFCLASGEYTRQLKDNGEKYTTKERADKSTGATLYAFDAATGKELYSSGKAISSFTHFGGLALNDGRVFLTTHDSTVYAFGIKGE